MANKDLKEFFSEEYKKISDAHFNVSQRITTFFQYMLAIYAAPLILFNTNINIPNDLKGIVFLFISVIGFFVCMYVNQLRCESLLYANSVNSMRSYYFDLFGKIEDKDYRYQVLPIQTRKPSFVDTYQFIWIVLTSAVVNSGYLIYGLTQLKNTFKNIINNQTGTELLPDLYETLILIIIFGLFVFLQLKFYVFCTRRVESGLNFFSHKIGVDIDGVLNEHERQFCNMARDVIKKDISPEQIVRIPVHKISGINISNTEEKLVFNTSRYWSDMPVKEGAKFYLKSIHDTFGLKIHVFTWRPWGEGKEQGHQKFNIEKLTKQWLYNNGFLLKKYRIRKHRDKCPIKSLKFEKGNYNAPISVKRAIYKNRFFYASKYKIKYFIEDELEKAIKLSSICKYVFLIDHLYNQYENLPFNVIRVKSWEEIYDKLKVL